MLRVRFFTLGCKVNQYETQALRELFRNEGYQEVDTKADFYVINTCTVTHIADKKSIKYIRKAKKENPRAKILVTGCLAEKQRALIEKEGVDFVVSQTEKYRIPQILGFKNSPFIKNNLSLRVSNFFLNRAFVKIQDGCNNSCSFCKVRLVRGGAISRPFKEIVSEIKILVERGFKEIVLCGINLGSYNWEGKDLCFLLRKIIRIEGLGRVRLSSLEPQYINEELLELISFTKKICSHLHLPFQSGSDKILQLMNKPVKANFYFQLISKIRSRIPNCGISGDFIVGFPYEEEKDFLKTLKLIKEVKPLRSHIFPYSEREETQSSKFPRLDKKVVKRRKEVAKEVAREASYEFRKTQENRIFEIILEEKQKESYFQGYTENYIKVLLEEVEASPFLDSKSLIPIVIEKVTPENNYAKLFKLNIQNNFLGKNPSKKTQILLDNSRTFNKI